MHDLIVDAFRQLLAKGMTHAEAAREFDKGQLAKALMDSNGDRSLLEMLARAGREEMNDRDMNDAIELWLAGWTSDPGTPPRDVFSWYWRAPAKGGRKLGRLYRSTGQAVNAFRKNRA